MMTSACLIFYIFNDNKAMTITKYVIYWSALPIMLLLAVFLFRSDIQIPQKEIIVAIDVKDKLNICTPEDDDNTLNKSFFDF